MIGVLNHQEDTAAVEEFFQLFKTPWAPYSPEESYDVVLVAGDEVPEIKSRLLIVFCSHPCPADTLWNFNSGEILAAPMLEAGNTQVPIYGEVLTFDSSDGADSCVHVNQAAVGLRAKFGDQQVLRIGFDLFNEVKYLFSEGQPKERATIPTLDLHIDLIRRWILEAGIPLVEITPSPFGFSHSVCLTHDIDFIGIRPHLLDHTLWGFAYRATLVALRDRLRRRISTGQLWRCWKAVLSLPLVYCGLAKDFWLPFEWLMQIENDLPTTYFLIPFKRMAGRKITAQHPNRRAAAYDVTDIPNWTQTLAEAGCEIGVHGIDGWNNKVDGEKEMQQISSVTGCTNLGVRTHWLLRDKETCRLLEEAGYRYDATEGYNETPGYRAGTGQVYKPHGARRLLELPLHIQDGALFFPERLGLLDEKAWELCYGFLERASLYGGVLTILWHDRSHAPERFWGGFYIRLIHELRNRNVWFCTGAQAVQWFSDRRKVTFQRTQNGTVKMVAHSGNGKALRPLSLRIHAPRFQLEPSDTTARWVEESWDGEVDLDLSMRVKRAMEETSETYAGSQRQGVDGSTLVRHIKNSSFQR